MPQQPLKQQQYTGLFTQADYGALREALNSLNSLNATLDKAASCGIECQMYRTMRTEIEKQLQALQQHFFQGYKTPAKV